LIDKDKLVDDFLNMYEGLGLLYTQEELELLRPNEQTDRQNLGGMTM